MIIINSKQSNLLLKNLTPAFLRKINSGSTPIFENRKDSGRSLLRHSGSCTPLAQNLADLSNPSTERDRLRPVLFRIRIFEIRSGRIMRFFWIRSRIGFHFCSSRIRIRIIQNGLNTFKFFCVLFFSCENFIDNLRVLMLDYVVYIVL